jgi:hypothetical protein
VSRLGMQARRDTQRIRSCRVRRRERLSARYPRA